VSAGSVEKWGWQRPPLYMDTSLMDDVLAGGIQLVR
jgi:hypothetical protein